jgi:hypothetical protein
MLGNIYVGEVWVNLAMVECGMAWFFVKYSKDQRLREAELNARERLVGLWRDPSSTAPWEWKKSDAKALVWEKSNTKLAGTTGCSDGICSPHGRVALKNLTVGLKLPFEPRARV